MVNLLLCRCCWRAERADTPPSSENALSQAGLVSLLLRAKIQEIRIEVEELTKLLEEDQDPEKMSTIQELIGVRCSLPLSARLLADELRAIHRTYSRKLLVSEMLLPRARWSSGTLRATFSRSTWPRSTS
jgi:hypothetical protein